MLINQNLGIVAYGTYIPRSVLPAKEIELAQNKVNSGIPQSLGVTQKTTPDIDEDTTTLSAAAGDQALIRWLKSEINSGKKQHLKNLIGALFIGSESHPYAVKPTGTMVKQSLGLSDDLALADLQFACKAGTQALQTISAYVAADLIPAGLAIGADTAQSQPGDVLEFTAGAGAAAYIIGKQKILARLIATHSIATDTPDFWRRPGESYPQHAGRFSGEPAYFHHIFMATNSLLAETKLQPADIDWVVFHTPNAKFPKIIAQKLGFKPTQMTHSLVVKEIGNTYAAASLIALASVLDHAGDKQKILVTSYGSGSGADSFLFETTSELPRQRQKWSSLLDEQIANLKPINYQEYRNNISSNH